MITLKDISKFERVLTSALEAEANYVLGIQFRTTELRRHRDQARSLAINAAREKAVSLAKELGQSVGQPQMIMEDQSDWWSWYNASWGSRWSGGMAQNVVQTAAGPATPENSIAVGQIVVSAGLTVQFELK